jgi:hypothetical protein
MGIADACRPFFEIHGTHDKALVHKVRSTIFYFFRFPLANSVARVDKNAAVIDCQRL